MSPPVVPPSLRRVFGHKVEAEFQRQELRRLRDERARKERREQSESKLDDVVGMAVTALSTSEVTLFKAELDTYDEATIIALQENEAALEIVRNKLDDLLMQAHVLPDGRRVFKTEDGSSVFDENGTQLDTSVIEPDVISNERPTWETFRAILDEREALENERADLLDYQGDLDDARDRLDSGEVTRDGLEQLRSNLRDGMPEAARKHLRQPDSDPDRSAKLDLELELTGDMVPTGLTPPRM